MSVIVQHRRDTRTNCEANTPAAGELWFDTTLKALRIGDGVQAGGFLQKLWGKSYTLSPAQITANQNDYSPTDLLLAETLLLDLDADRSLTGLALGATNREVTVYNRSAFRLTLAHENAGSTAGNRFHNPANLDVVLRYGQSARLLYSATLSRWIVTGAGASWLGVTDLPEALTLSGECRPAAVTANQNDWDPSDVASSLAWSTSRATNIYVSTDASRNFTGLAGGAKGRLAIISNNGTFPAVLKNADTGSSAANRLDIGADVTLATKQVAILEYDSTASRWKMLANTAGAAVADGAVTAVKLAGSALGARCGMINGTLVASRAGNAETYAVKTLAGTDPTASDPVLFIFQTGAGAYVMRSVTAALSVTVSSGSTLGAANATAFRVWVVAIDNAGTVELGVVNCRAATGILALPEFAPVTTTAEGGAGASDSAQVIYSTAARTSKYICLVGYANYESGLTTAGTWVTAPDNIVLFAAGVARPGDVLQERLASKTDVFTSTTTTTWTDLTGLSVSLTPSSKCNPLRIGGVILGTSQGQVCHFRVMRGATAVGIGDAASSRSSVSSSFQRLVDSVTIVSAPFAPFYDFAQSVASLTIKIQFFLQSGTLYINQTSGDVNSSDYARAVSGVFAHEIMG